jgi:undecaprenyl-diphosphatase
MNPLDYSIISFFNQFAQQSLQFDNLVLLISDNVLLKGGVIIALVWWGWFQKDSFKNIKRNREHILTTVLASSIAIIGVRLLALLLPFRLRPLHNPEIALQFPLEKEFLEGWSSFPSDHALLFFTLATGLFFVSRILGAIAIAHAILVICLPRIYLGLHYPTDILVGALLGIGVSLWVNRKQISSTISKLPLRLLDQNPSLFYSCFFIVIFEIAEMFNSLRNIVGVAF